MLKDIGSGLNENRRNFNKLLEMVMNKEVSDILVAYPDRLTSFEFKMLEKFFEIYGVRITVIEHERKEPLEELVEGLITIISHFAGKLYGKKSRKYKEVVEGTRKLVCSSQLQSET